MTLLSQLTEVRIHGRAGSGVVSAGYLLAVAAFHDKKFSQAFPMFGIERSGSPVTSYVRISDRKIDLRSQIYEPDYSIVFDPSLLASVDVAAGVKNCVVINSKKPLDIGPKAVVVDASKFGTTFFNVSMIAAFAHCTSLVSKSSVLKAVEEIFSRKGDDIVSRNKAVVENVFRENICPVGLK